MLPLNVTRTNYDRFETGDGTILTGAAITAVRESGRAVLVTDATPAQKGCWTLEPL